ncbi:MAG: hypothetical protein ABIR46_00170 [Candidatus Saccharimonadales bacterium]
MSETNDGSFNENDEQIAPIERFRIDMRYASSYFELFNGFAKYMSGLLGISDDASMRLYSKISDKLPDADLYNTDPEMSQEQMQLGLIRVVLPLIEEMGISRDTYAQWLRESVPVALGSSSGRHTREECADYNPAGINDVACDVSHSCPVKVVRHALISGALNPDFTTPDYEIPWLDDTIYRTQLKLDTATAKGLIDYEYATLIKNNYVNDLKNLELVIPET